MKNASLERVFSCEIWEICWNTFFTEHHRMNAFDFSSVNSNEGRIGKQNRKLLKREPEWKNKFQKQWFADFKLGIFKNCINFTRKHLYWSLFFKVAGLKVCNSIKKRLQYSCFPVKFANFLKTPFLQNSFSGYFWGLCNSCFQRSPEQKPTEAVIRRCFVKKDVLRNFAKFTGKYLCQSLFFNKVAGLRPETLLKKRLWHLRNF